MEWFGCFRSDDALDLATSLLGEDETGTSKTTRRGFYSPRRNLGNFLRRLALPRYVKHWSLTTLREKLIKIGAKVVRHAKYVTFQMAEVAVPRDFLAAILERIQSFGVPPRLVQRG